MYYIFNGIQFGSWTEAKEAKDDLVKNGQAAKDAPIIEKKLW